MMNGGKKLKKHWTMEVVKLTLLPSVIVEIIFDYTIVPARQQFLNKYFGVQRLRRWCVGVSSSTGIYPKNCCKERVVVMDRRSTDSCEKCQVCQGYTRYLSLDKEYDYCRLCIKNGEQMRIVQKLGRENRNRNRNRNREYDANGCAKDIDHNVDKVADKESMFFDACGNCSMIDFCPQAKNGDENDVCLMNIRCILCRTKVCAHDVYESFTTNAVNVDDEKEEDEDNSNQSSSTSSPDKKCLCQSCGEYSLLGRRIIETIINHPPPAYQDFIQGVLSLPLNPR
jgi:hypothetical protein